MGLLLSLQGIFTPKISAKIHTRGAPNWRRTDYVCSNFREFQKLKKPKTKKTKPKTIWHDKRPLLALGFFATTVVV